MHEITGKCILKYILEIWKQFSVEKKCQKNNNKISKDGY